ncbi:hypothetical protein C0991_011041 [Blastosporella zonata]|nr:hypothetical protein C0991_011041 [Blastosporella zonata]
MPRARAQVTAILERLILIRENIQNLTETLQQAQAIEVPSVKSLITEEEKRVQSLQARLNALQEREKNAFAAKASAKAKTALPHPHSKLKAPPSPSSSQEDSFWNTPAATARTLRFTDNIMDAESLLHEQVDLGDISSASFTSPMPTSRSMRVSPQDDSLQISPNTLFPIDDDNETKEEDEEEYEAEAGEDEKTVVMKRPNPEPQIPPALSDAQELTPETPASDTPGTKSSKVKINSEVERITTKIWTTMGDTIMPGHSFDTSQGGAGSKPPRAKETIAHLQSLSALSPSPSSPSVSSVSSASAAVPAPPTSQQILTAHMLLALLTSPPQFSLPLNKMKDLLAAKASSGGGAVATGTTRILYGCVAKRLVKIDRSGGEQIVKFDV